LGLLHPFDARPRSPEELGPKNATQIATKANLNLNTPPARRKFVFLDTAAQSGDEQRPRRDVGVNALWLGAPKEGLFGEDDIGVWRNHGVCFLDCCLTLGDALAVIVLVTRNC
jgi:hypothetical protein